MVEFSAGVTCQSGTPSSGSGLAPFPGPPAAHRAETTSDFASQLIAARDRLPVQRARRRAGEGDALLAYDHSARLGERRVPKGYFLTRSV